MKYLAAGLVAALLSATPAVGTTVYWSGSNGGNWSVSSNWLGGVAPVANDSLVFADYPSTCCAPSIVINNDFPANTAFDSLSFVAGPTNFSATGNAVNLGAGGVHQGAATKFFGSIPLVLTASQTWTTQSPGHVDLYSPASLDLGANNLTISGSGTHSFQNTITGTGGITLNGSLAITFSGTMSYTGATVVGGSATLQLATPNAIATPIVINSGAFLYDVAGSAAVMNAPLTINAGGTFQVVINPATSNVTVNVAPITLSGNLAVGDYVVAPVGTVYTIIGNQTGNAVAGAFAGLPEGATFTSGANTFRISYLGGSGHDVTLTVVAPRADLNADGKSDVVWRNPATGDDAAWLMNGTSILSAAPLPTVSDLSWTIGGSGDFDANVKSDLIWVNGSTGDVVIWLMDGTTVPWAVYVTTLTSTSWHIGGVADFNFDGKADVIWRNGATGEVVVWLMDGTAIGNAAYLPTIADLNWGIVGVGDFNGDAMADVFWRNSATGENVVWLMNGTSMTSATFIDSVSDLNYRVVGVGDLDADRKADLVWWNQSTGDVAVWLMDGATIGSRAVVTTVSDLNWHPEAVGDFDGDGKADIFWRNVATGDTVVWLMNGSSIKQASFVTTLANTNWAVAAPR